MSATNRRRSHCHRRCHRHCHRRFHRRFHRRRRKLRLPWLRRLSGQQRWREPRLVLPTPRRRGCTRPLLSPSGLPRHDRCSPSQQAGSPQRPLHTSWMVNWRPRPSRHHLRLRVLRRRRPRLSARIVNLVAAGAAVAGVKPTSIGVAGALVNHDDTCERAHVHVHPHSPVNTVSVALSLL